MMTSQIHHGGPLDDGIGSSTGAAGENAPNAGRSSSAVVVGPSEGELRVLAAMARMSISPEPSVVGAGAEPRLMEGDGLAAGIASDCRFESENSTEFSWRWPVRFSTRPPSWPAIDTAPPPEDGQFEAELALDEECDPNRSPPDAGAAAAGAAKTSPTPSPNSGRFAPDRRRPPLRSVPLVGWGAALSDANTSPTLTEPLSAGTRSANSGTADSFSQSAKPSFQMYVSGRISPRSMRARTSASGIGPTCSPSTTMCQPPSAAAAAGAAAASSCPSPPRTTM